MVFGRIAGRIGASMGMVVVSLASVGALSALSAPEARATVPGQPGTPQAPTVLYDEGFSNGLTGGPATLTGAYGTRAYVGAAGDTFNATGGGGGYADPSVCNGVIMTGNTGLSDPPYCENAQPPGTSIADITKQMRAFATILGQFNGTPNPASNYAVTDLTAFNEPAPLVELATQKPIVLSEQNHRFLSYSINVTADCGPAAPVQPVLTFNAGGLNNQQWDPCQHGGTAALAVNGAALFTGTNVAFEIINDNGGGIQGNDAAFDDFKVIDETPQLDQAFNATSIPAGGVSTLTFTITNTSELNAKDGWGFTDNLPAGLTLADNKTTTTCSSGTITANTGSAAVTVAGGDLKAGQKSCTITVDVTASTSGTYTNTPGDFTLTGVNPPGPAALTVSPQIGTPLADGWIVGGVVAVAAVGGFGGFLRIRNRRRRMPA